MPRGKHYTEFEKTSLGELIVKYQPRSKANWNYVAQELYKRMKHQLGVLGASQRTGKNVRKQYEAILRERTTELDDQMPQYIQLARKACIQINDKKRSGVPSIDYAGMTEMNVESENEQFDSSFDRDKVMDSQLGASPLIARSVNNNKSMTEQANDEMEFIKNGECDSQSRKRKRDNPVSLTSNTLSIDNLPHNVRLPHNTNGISQHDTASNPPTANTNHMLERLVTNLISENRETRTGLEEYMNEMENKRQLDYNAQTKFLERLEKLSEERHLSLLAAMKDINKSKEKELQEKIGQMQERINHLENTLTNLATKYNFDNPI